MELIKILVEIKELKNGKNLNDLINKLKSFLNSFESCEEGRE